MAGRYYAATPIGEGMENLATAIGGLPRLQAQAALLAQRRDLVEAQILTQGAQRDKYEEEMLGKRQNRLGRQGMADAILASGTQGGGGPDTTPTTTSPEPIPSPSNPAGGGGMAAAFGADSNPAAPVATPVRFSPGAPAVPAAPNVAGAVVPPPNRTGWTPDINRRYYAQAVLANEDKAPDYVRGFMGGNLAATETDPVKALSFGQAGAGQSWKTTPTGEAAQLAETNRKNTLTSQDNRYKADQTRIASEYGADARAGATRDAAVTRANAPGKGGKGKARELTPTQQSKLLDEVNVEVGKQLGRRLTPDEARQVAGAVSDSYAAGDSYLDAKAKVLDGLVSGEAGQDWSILSPSSWGKSKPDTRKLNLPQRGSAAAPAGDAPAVPAGARMGGRTGPTNDAERAMADEIAALPPVDIPREIATVERDLATGNLNADDRAQAQQYLAGLKARQGKGAPAAAAPAPAAAPAAAPATPKKGGKDLEARIAKAKANGWSDVQIAAQLRKEGY